MPRSKSSSSPVASLRLGPSCRMWVALVLSCMATRSSKTVFGNRGGFMFVDAINGDSNFNYEARTDISSWLKLASDIKEMRSASSNEERQRIYTEGNHSSMSLQSLSLTSYDLFHDVPIYNVYLSAFRTMGKNANFSGVLTVEELGNFDGAPIQHYADTLVLDLFDLGIPRIEGTGSVVFNVLMAHWGHLWLMLQECHANQDAVKALQHLDTAVALWVGEGQIRNDKQKGYFMYSLSQFAGVQFGQDDAESVQNGLVLQVLASLQSILQDNETCANSDAASYISMRWDVQLLMQYANTILVQLLLHSIQDLVDNGGSSDFVELYSLAINPQIAVCDVDLYQNITDLTVLNDLTEDTRDAAIAALQASYSCLGITCSDVGAYLDGLIPMCVDRDSEPTAPLPALAGYQPTRDVRDLSHLDRDIRQIDLFLGYGSYLAALDYYFFGWNSEVTLQEIASNNLTWTPSPLFDAVERYYGTADLSIDMLVQDAIVGSGAFAKADGGVRRGVVTGTLQSVVMYLGATGQSVSALTACASGKTEEAQARWDSAVALIVGSAEGSNPKGKLDGQSLFAISKSFCNAFDTCEPTSSVVDTIILASYQSGAEALVEGECEMASEIYLEKIEANMLLPLVQGFLFYAVEVSTTDNVASPGYLVAYTKGMLPFLEGADPDAFSLGDNTGDVNVAAYFAAVQNALPNMGIDCARVGKISVNGVLTGVCPDDELPPSTSLSSGSSPAPSLPPIFVPDPHQDGLAWGRYTFFDESVAENDSLFTLDVRDMWNSSTPQAAEDIYTNPSKYAVDGLAGRSEINGLRKLSTMAYTFMSEDPMYNFFRVALFEDEAFEDNSEDRQEWPYADAVEELAVGPENGNSAQLAAETVTVMEIWMMIANRLYDAVRFCREGDDAPELIDSAVGLWIGQEQGEGKFNSGWSIYAKAQQAIQRFGISEREAKVNTQLMEQFVVAQTLAMTCSTETANFPVLRSLVDDIIRNLSIPLVQHLLFHMSENNFEYIELYALSFIPQVISVDVGAFEFLRDRLFEGFNWDTSLDNDLFSVIGKSLQAMRISCSDLGDPSSSGIDNLIGLVEALCNELDTKYNTDRIAGYETSADVMELARIDLDVLQIDLFMRAKAYESALDVYQYGRNARKSSTELYNLKDLATTDEYSNDGFGKLFSDFFLNATYPDKIITDALVLRGGRFAGASRRQLSEAVRGTLQTMVMYNQIHGRLAGAIKQCVASVEKEETGSASLTGTGQGLVDEAVALYVGSIEGPFSGGNPAAGGQFLYALGKEMCLYFNTCETRDGTYADAEVNIQLLYAFADTKESLDNGECASAEEIITDNILPSLQIPLVQGILYYASSNEGLEAGSSNATLVAGQVLTETMLPQIEKSNETSAEIIFENMDFDLEQTAVLDGAEVVFDAMAKALPGMKLECDSIGSLSTTLSVCPLTFDTPNQDPPPEIAPDASTPVTLGDNLYETTTYVQDRADIAKDAAEIKEELEKGGSRIDFAKLVYRKGRYSDVYDDEGNLTQEPRSFAKFSKEASTTMQGNPLYQIAVYALKDDKGLYLGEDASQFADTIVELMFLSSAETEKPYAAEAAIALNLWMELANELFETVSNCKNKTLTDADGIHSIDEAVAYWVGDGQITGSDEGHLLYALAEEMAQHFSISSSPHSRTNTNILRLFHQAKLAMSLTGACTTNGETAAQIRRLVDKIVSQMMIVNVQALIHFLRQEDERERVRIYAHAVVPLAAGCNPKTFKYLKEKLLDVSYLDVDVEQIIANIRMTLPCFGLKCADVGVHTTEPPSACSDPTPTSALADYKPTTDVQAFAEIDLDIMELDILMEMEAFDAAEDLYSFGKHVSLGASGEGTALSLKQLATNSGRISTPQYEFFVKYFGDDKYADTIVRQALSNTGNVTMSSIQRRVLVVGASRHMIAYMAVLESMYDAIGACTSSEPERNSDAWKYWDMASAFLIGSLEGHRMGGSDDGLLLWGLSKQVCDEFGTCSSETPNSSKSNDEMAKYLFSGRSAALNGNCDALKSAANELSPLLLVPLLQASFSTITRLSERKPGENKEQLQAEAYILTQSLLPLISAGNRRSASILEENLTLQDAPLQDGVRVVISALAESLSDIGVECEDVGSSKAVDTCSGNTKSKDSQILFIVLGSLLGSIAIVGIYLLLRSKRKKNLPENQPLFIKPKNAELNHDADLLISRTAQSSPRDLDEGEDDNLILANDADSTLESDEGDEAYMQAIENVLSERLQVV